MSNGGRLIDISTGKIRLDPATGKMLLTNKHSLPSTITATISGITMCCFIGTGEIFGNIDGVYALTFDSGIGGYALNSTTPFYFYSNFADCTGTITQTNNINFTFTVGLDGCTHNISYVSFITTGGPSGPLFLTNFTGCPCSFPSIMGSAINNDIVSCVTYGLAYGGTVTIS